MAASSGRPFPLGEPSAHALRGRRHGCSSRMVKGCSRTGSYGISLSSFCGGVGRESGRGRGEESGGRGLGPYQGFGATREDFDASLNHGKAGKFRKRVVAAMDVGWRSRENRAKGDGDGERVGERERRGCVPRLSLQGEGPAESFRMQQRSCEWSPLSLLLGSHGRPPAVFEDIIQYFAFGSNMSLEKLTSRGGGVRVVAAEAGRVAEHRVAFNLLCLPPFEPAMAGLEPAMGESAHGLLVTLERASYERLYLSEGGAGGPWRSYIEHEVMVTTYSGQQVPAITFRTNPDSPMKLPRWLELPPSRRYRDLILKGAKESGLEEWYIERLSQIQPV